jgi:hypothetical protein
MKKTDILNRAKKAVTESVARYKLGTGGFNPSAPLPESKQGYCDCSGFVSWCLNEKRQTSNKFLMSINGGWIETTAVVKDAKSPDGMFTKVDKPEPGDLAVWGDNKGRQGHIGVVSEAVVGVATKIIHCSSGNFKKTGKAIQETDAEMFYRCDAIFVKFDKIEE